MTKAIQAQLHALDRVMYLLEEDSIQVLATDSETFASFVEELYAKVDRQALQLSMKQSA
jgi:hypothetical protein